MFNNYKVLFSLLICSAQVNLFPCASVLSNSAQPDIDYLTDGPYSSQVDPNLARWSNYAFDYIKNFSCEEVFLISREDCYKLQTALPEQMNLYFAQPTKDRRYRIVLPDGDTSKTGAHDAVLAIDPFPTANFGHVVLVFLIDLSWTQMQCEIKGGRFMGNDECLTLALKNRCHNLIETALSGVSRKRNFARRCEINFLPVVHFDGEQPPYDNQLECVDYIEGFASCPTLRTVNETSSLVCDHLATNSFRCFVNEETIQTRCRLLETCDQAVLISGGWNRLASPLQYKDNLVSVYEMLRQNGYHKSGIKIFYANGDSPIYGPNAPNDDTHPVFPSTFKLAMRYHIQKMCQSPGCVDTLFIYMNSPTRGDGASLLWDGDGNGIAEEHEVYTHNELLYDVRDCKGAEQVVVLADQNFSGEMLKTLNKDPMSESYENLKVFTSGEEHEYSWNSQLTKHWTRFKHSHGCIRTVYDASKTSVVTSTPKYYDGSHRTLSLTLSGAPCDINPPYSQRELEKFYFGCQNVPTAIWLSKRLNG